ncbi:methyltransferase-like protein 23 isoform X5 [Phyllopteryx taeniolatus]|uniref:methyltransferase-like protein 23 isoform X5 n=1 Tax=Phyllopteryx taeniolatus TaxID=161469 RepID=UPI002AD4AC95|nr:methyltransferase-like protein 23 isoform X5 [Phyllopteryx taeniolatus]
MGKFGIRERNSEGQMAVDFAKRMEMAVVNTFFQKRQEHRVTSKSGAKKMSNVHVLDAQYGMYVWPSAVVLAQYIWSRRADVKDKTVLELGAGVSLPGVLASRCGAKVILSDAADSPACLENCRRSCEANGLCDVLTLPLTWGEISPRLLRLPRLHLILASDVFYEPRGSGKVVLPLHHLPLVCLTIPYRF